MAEGTQVAAQTGNRPGMLALLKQTNLRTLWLAQTVSWSGDHFTFLALMIVLNQATGSAGAIGLLMIVMTLPRLLFGMVAGVFVDRWDRQRLMVAADALRGLLSLGLVWAATSQHIWLVYPLGFLTSAVGVFFMPARGAIMKTILRPDELLPANILLQTTYTITLVIGPALAGILIGTLGVGPAFVFDALTFFVSAGLVATLALPKLWRDDGQATKTAGFWSEFNDGLAFVQASRSIMGLLLVLTVISLATGAVNVLFVPFMMNVIHVGATELGLADSVQGLGMIAGGVLAAGVAARLRASHIMAGGLFLAGLAITAIGLAPSFPVVLALLLVVGVIVTPIEATIPAVMQKLVPLEKMGRVGGTMNTSQSMATLVSMGIGGIVADIVGPRTVFVAAGLIGVLAAMVALGAIRDEAPAPVAEVEGQAEISLAIKE